MNKAILHVDMNNFFASVELLSRPELRDVPVIVCGDEKSRRGVVLAKNQAAKTLGIKTAETVFSARQKAPNVVCLPPHFDQYEHYSKLARKLYETYTPYVESFGLDECWLKLDQWDTAAQTADQIRQDVKHTFGLTVSIGVSFTKVFAKLGSDYKKPDAVTVISRDNYKTILWPLPVQALLYVGKATTDKLGSIGIQTIGQLASTDVLFLERLLGKMGRLLWSEANGIEQDEVAAADRKRQAKSIGNSMTLVRDATSMGEIMGALRWLADSVATRLQADRRCCRTVQIMVKDSTFASQTRQAKLPEPCQDRKIIFDHAMALFQTHFDLSVPIRGLGLTASDLGSADDPVQLSFEDLKREQARAKVMSTINRLNERYGKIIDIGSGNLDSAAGKK